MTQWNARLMNRPKLQEFVSLTDELSDHCQEAANALADYESADDLSGPEATEAREEAREYFAQAVTDLIATSERIKGLAEPLQQKISA